VPEEKGEKEGKKENSIDVIISFLTLSCNWEHDLILCHYKGIPPSCERMVYKISIL
jgi:hypothetical protein